MYDGNAAAWHLRAISFKRFLRRNDERWLALLARKFAEERSLAVGGGSKASVDER